MLFVAVMCYMTDYFDLLFEDVGTTMEVYKNFLIDYYIYLRRKNKMKNKNNRFIIVHTEGSALKTEGLREIFVDKETGVNYLVVTTGYGLGITPLIDKDGKPIITGTDF